MSDYLTDAVAILETLPPRITDRIEEDSAGCWLWSGTVVGLGYGQVSYHGRSSLTHRLAWQAARSEIPSGICVLHKCDVPACCNPAHLFLGTNKENSEDMVRKGRSRTGKRPTTSGARNPSSKLTDLTVLEIRRLYKTGEHTCAALGARFGVTRVNVGCIVRRASWKHI